MSAASPPLRFLAAVVGGWAAVRAAMLAPLWSSGPIAEPRPPRVTAAEKVAGTAVPLPAAVLVALDAPSAARVRSAFAEGSAPREAVAAAVPPASRRRLPGPDRPVEPAALLSSVAASPPPTRSIAGRWSASAWALLRHGDGAAALASGGTLGGGQIGARLTYRLNRSGARPLALSARLSAPARRPQGAEAAIGLEWQPVAGVPLRLLAERRQALGGEARSAFALLAYGGIHDRPVAAGFRLEAYAQAGIVGARSRDLFADGAARLSRRIDEQGRIRLGAGVWAAAQPGVARLDAGPHASLRLSGVTVALDWRVRLAGDAAPGSGPAATLSTDF